MPQPQAEPADMDIGVFIMALIIAYLLPGPDMVLILHLGGQHRAGIAAALGLALARTCHVLLALAGLVSVMTMLPWAELAIRWLGCAYLLWLGIGIWRSPLAIATDPADPADPAPPARYWQAWRLGLLTNLLNPKALLFCSVLLPQFLPSNQADWGARATLLGAILVGLGLAFDLIYVFVGHGLARWQRAHPSRQIWRNRIFGSALIIFALMIVSL